MGAGASATNKITQENCWIVTEIKDPVKEEYHLTLPSPLVLMVTQESLDLTPVDKSDNTVLHYPYHQIKCWSSTSSFFSFQLGVEKVQTILKFQTTEGTIIQSQLLDTILKFMAQSKQGALQPPEFKEFRRTLFNDKKELVPNWNEVAD
eukprot:CAMPEP_0114460926 /NCGR_PEP_ID=MMETSP0104-20121206/6006_1 /TAXON_ID=37642 ORGANISM="Paraphysomonas imperforata, Strain PA2" /NCGR_SAMPLE_ID=MMETSP0104 /ASSEMBLY_ACC=CAM_ASM_000202 /LENGTH=148 /DNA_ID=CAMNT_0001633671 /DNA_START=182 /DNA_END=628 /DNA_ORIENTATION=+